MVERVVTFEMRMKSYEFIFHKSRRRFQASISPNRTLNTPANNLMPPLTIEKRRAVTANGSPIIALIRSIPPIEPMPNTVMYKSPNATDGIVVRTASVSAALPATP